MWKSRLSDSGPKYMKVVSSRQYYHVSDCTPKPRDTYSSTYLAFVKHRAIAVEQLEGCDDVTLYQNSRDHSRCCPPSCAHGHLKEPLF